MINIRNIREQAVEMSTPNEDSARSFNVNVVTNHNSEGKDNKYETLYNIKVCDAINCEKWEMKSVKACLWLGLWLIFF